MGVRLHKIKIISKNPLFCNILINMNIKTLFLFIIASSSFSFEEIGLIDPKMSELQEVASERIIRPQVKELVEYLKPKKKVTKTRSDTLTPSSYIDLRGELQEQDEVIDIIVD